MRRGAHLLLPALLLAAGCAGPGSASGSAPAEEAAPAPVEGWGEPDAGRPEGEPRFRPEGTPRWERESDVHATWIPYAWRTASSGEQSRSGLKAPFEDVGETVGGVRGEASLDRVAWGFDAFLARATGEEGGVEGDLDYFTVRFAANMRIAGPGPAWRDEGDPLSVVPTADVFFGARIHGADGTLEDAAAWRAAERSAWWAEPVVGARATATVLRRVTLFGRAEAGGIHVGSWESWSYDLEAGASLALTENLGLAAAWRSYGAAFRDDPEDDAPWELEARFSGPWVGLVLEF